MIGLVNLSLRFIFGFVSVAVECMTKLYIFVNEILDFLNIICNWIAKGRIDVCLNTGSGSDVTQTPAHIIQTDYVKFERELYDVINENKKPMYHDLPFIEQSPSTTTLPGMVLVQLFSFYKPILSWEKLQKQRSIDFFVRSKHVFIGI